MRRSDREVTDFNEIVEIINKCDCIRLGFSSQPVPYILPLNFGIEVVDKKILLYFHSATEGYKTTLIKEGTEVSFECDTSHNLIYVKEKGFCTFTFESVMGMGKLHIISDDNEKIRALDLLMKHHHTSDESVFCKVNGFPVTFNPAALSRTMVYSLQVSECSAKRKI